MEEKARRINISSTGRAINNGDKQGWVSNSQTRVTPQTPQAAQCVGVRGADGRCPDIEEMVTNRVGLVR